MTKNANTVGSKKTLVYVTRRADACFLINSPAVQRTWSVTSWSYFEFPAHGFRNDFGTDRFD